MKNSILIFLLLLLTLNISSSLNNVFSQTIDSLINPVQFGKILGIVVDSKELTPLINAECMLYKNKDTIVYKHSRTDSSGHFLIDSITHGKYWMEIEFVGYASYINNKIHLDENNLLISIDTIKLKNQNVETEEVLVEGEKPLFTFEGDKKVFNVTEAITNSGGTVLDVLKKVPMVDVDINDNVTLRGSQNVKILIDNKENRYMNLKQIPAEGVEKVELITNPPAKYASEGVTGIINIVMKKSDKLGFNGYSNISFGSKDKYSGGLNIDFKKNKTTIFTNGYLGIYNYNSVSKGETQFLIPAVSYINNNGSYEGKNYYYYLSPGIEYDVMKSSVIGMEGNYSFGKYKYGSNNITQYQDANRNLNSYYANNNNSSANWYNYFLSGYMDLKLNEKGKELSSDLTYSKNKSTSNSWLERQYYDSLSSPLNNTPLNENDNTIFISNNLNAQLDYTHPFGKSNQIETGYKGTYRVNDNDYNSDTLNYSSGNYVDNINLSNHFKLSEMINAVYFMFGSKIKGLSFKFGLRVENTNSKSELLTGYQTFSRNYSDIFPTVNLSQKIGQSNQLQLSYSRRITRPSTYRLNPFINRSNPNYIYYGNPQLNPEFTDSYELSYMLFTKALTVTPSAFFRRQHDVISSYSYLTDSGVTVTTYKNATGANSYGLDFIVTSRSFDWMNLNATFSCYNTKFDQDYITDYVTEQGFTWRANIRAYFSISKIFKIELYYNYNGKKVNAQNIYQPSQNLDAGFSINLFKEKATIRFTASDIFKTQQWANTTNGIGFNSSYKYQYDSRVMWLTISYRFGNTDEYYQKKKKTKQNENESNDSGDEAPKK